METKKLWFIFISILIVCFTIIGFFGHEIYREKPPIPDKIISEDGKVIFTSQDIQDGQNIWQSIGGQEVETAWGHGAYVAPEWSVEKGSIKNQ
jgi:nitric oxide reductase subunit B